MNFCRAKLAFSPRFHPSAPMLSGVSAGWIGVSMESVGGECCYHVLGLLYGKSPQELKQRAREVVVAQYDTDLDLQRSVREAVRDKVSSSGEMTVDQLKAAFLAELDLAWGGSALISILAKHASGAFCRFQPWAVNWERGGVVRLGMDSGAALHVFVARRDSHYYLLSRVPLADHRVHPYVFSDVDEARACELAEYHNKATTEALTPTEDHMMEIDKQEFHRH